MPRHKNADWIIAWAEGKEVEASYEGSDTWRPVLENGDGTHYNSLVFCSDMYEFRLKPREPRRVWINNYGQLNQSWHPSRESADEHAVSGRTECVEFVEVMKESAK